MDSKIINQFPIRDYLAGSGIYPVKDNNFCGMYYSPFREDYNASMKVDYNKNLWIDYGIGEGGTLIDLVMRIQNCSNGRAMQLLEQKIAGMVSFSFQKEKKLFRKFHNSRPFLFRKLMY
jgi:DNA primase